MSRRPRVMFLSSCVRGGGAGQSLYYLLKHLDRSVIEPLVVVPDQGIFRDRFAALGLAVITLPRLPERTRQLRFSRPNGATRALSLALNLADSARCVPTLARIIRRERVDLVHCNNMMVKPIGTAAAQLASVPCVLHVRNLHERRLAVGLYCQTVARFPVVERVVANSRASAAPYRRAVPGKVVVVHNGIDLDEFGAPGLPRAALRRQLGLGPDELVIVFTGHLIARKGLDVLVRAFARCAARRERLQLVIAGRVPVGESPEYLARCQGLCADLGVASRARFLGFLSDVREVVAAADVLVLPSLQEPFGRSIIEAMALGTPVVASRVGGIVEIVDDGVEGLLVPPGDVAALAAALERLAADPLLREQLAARARQKVRDRFDVEKLTRELQDVLAEAAGRR